jgi:DHA1 family tetracycline resistance protein-like MFS transporter
MNGPRKATVGFIFVTLFLDVLGMGIVIPVAPRLIASFLAEPAAQIRAYGAFVAVYALMLFFFSPILGSLSDKVGRRPVILGSLLGSALDYILLATAPSLWLLFVGRAIAGITGASAASVGAYIADVSPPEKRAQNFGMMGLAFGLGFIAGPLLGGLVGDLGERLGFGIRLPFYVAAALTLANAMYGMFVLPESLPPKNRKPFTFASTNPFAAIPALRKYPIVFDLAAAVCLRNLAEYSLHATWVLYTTHKFGWSIRQNGISLAVDGVVIAIVQGGLIRVVVPRFGERRAVIVGYVVAAASYLFYGAATAGWMMYVIIVASGLGQLAGPTTHAIITRHVPANEQGAVQGSLTSLGSLTGILAPAIATSLFGFFVSDQAPIKLPGAPFFAGCLFTVAAVVLVMRSFARHPPPPPGANAAEGDEDVEKDEAAGQAATDGTVEAQP